MSEVGHEQHLRGLEDPHSRPVLQQQDLVLIAQPAKSLAT